MRTNCKHIMRGRVLAAAKQGLLIGISRRQMLQPACCVCSSFRAGHPPFSAAALRAATVAVGSERSPSGGRDMAASGPYPPTNRHQDLSAKAAQRHSSAAGEDVRGSDRAAASSRMRRQREFVSMSDSFLEEAEAMLQAPDAGASSKASSAAPPPAASPPILDPQLRSGTTPSTSERGDSSAQPGRESGHRNSPGRVSSRSGPPRSPTGRDKTTARSTSHWDDGSLDWDNVNPGNSTPARQSPGIGGSQGQRSSRWQGPRMTTPPGVDAARGRGEKVPNEAASKQDLQQNGGRFKRTHRERMKLCLGSNMAIKAAVSKNTVPFAFHVLHSKASQWLIFHKPSTLRGFASLRYTMSSDNYWLTQKTASLRA